MLAVAKCIRNHASEGCFITLILQISVKLAAKFNLKALFYWAIPPES